MRPHPSASRGQWRESSRTNKWAQSKLQPMPKLNEVQLVASVESSCLKRSQRGHGALFSNLHRCRQNWTSDLKSQQTRRQKWSCWDSSSPHVQFWWVFGLIWYKIDESQHFCWVETGCYFWERRRSSCSKWHISDTQVNLPKQTVGVGGICRRYLGVIF